MFVIVFAETSKNVNSLRRIEDCDRVVEVMSLHSAGLVELGQIGIGHLLELVVCASVVDIMVQSCKNHGEHFKLGHKFIKDSVDDAIEDTMGDGYSVAEIVICDGTVIFTNNEDIVNELIIENMVGFIVVEDRE